MGFRILTVGWEPDFIHELLCPIEKYTGINFVHGLVGDASRIDFVKKRYASMEVFSLSKAKEEELPSPDLDLLSSLESVGVPTIKSMIQGDRVLRCRNEVEALGYATLLANRLLDCLRTYRPDVVLASHDSMHAAMSLAVAKFLSIPWVAMAFPVIPENLTGFCNALTPDSLVPIFRPVNQELKKEAKSIIQNVRSKKQHVVAYKAPVSIAQWLIQYGLHAKNLLRRSQNEMLGIDRFTYPSKAERLCDVARRSFNRLRLPTDKMLRTPPNVRYVYFPFHMSPESMLDTWSPFFQDQLAFVRQISLAMPVGVVFVVKLHFSDPDNYSRRELMQLINLPRLHIAHPNASGNEFLEKAALVVGIQGTSCLEAALLGKPVLIFGDSPYQHFPSAERAKRPDELFVQIQRMIDQTSAADGEIVDAYAAYMARYMPGRVNDWGQQLQPDQIRDYADCFCELRSYVENLGNCNKWYSQSPFED